MTFSDLKKYGVWFYNESDYDFDDDYEIIELFKNKNGEYFFEDLYYYNGSELIKYKNDEESTGGLIGGVDLEFIEFTSDSLEECKERIVLIYETNKYNL